MAFLALGGNSVAEPTELVVALELHCAFPFISWTLLFTGASSGPPLGLVLRRHTSFVISSLLLKKSKFCSDKLPTGTIFVTIVSFMNLRKKTSGTDELLRN
jgi:hypothetical protein